MDEVTHRWILEVLGAHDVREERTLTFGISSDMRLIEADGIPLVLKRNVNELVNELPMAIACEVQALKAARTVLGDMVPEPVAFDVTGDRSGCPSLIMTYLPGEPAYIISTCDRSWNHWPDSMPERLRRSSIDIAIGSTLTA